MKKSIQNFSLIFLMLLLSVVAFGQLEQDNRKNVDEDLNLKTQGISNPYIDDVNVAELSTTPLIASNVSALDFDIVEEFDQENPFGDVVELSNIGIDTLTVTSITDLSGTDFSTNMLVSDVSLPNGDSVYTFGFTYSPSDVGADTVDFVIESNGGYHTIRLTGKSYAFNTLFESFEGEIFPPDFWITTGDLWSSKKSAQNSYHGDKYCRYRGTDTLITPELVINDGDELKFYAKNSAISGGSLTFISSTDLVNWNSLSDVSLTSDYMEYVLDLSSLANNGRAYVGILGESRVYFDLVRGPEMYKVDNDLAAVDVSGLTTPANGEENVYIVTVRNYGLNEQTNYSVKLYTIDGTEVGSVPGDPIAFNEFLSYEIPCIFDDEGDNGLYAETILASDEIMVNNISEVLYFDVQPQGFKSVVIGESDLKDNLLPLNDSWENSFTQSLYFPEELGAKGIIKSITYNCSVSTDSVKYPIEVWLGETNAMHLADSFLSTKGMSLVFDSIITLYKRDNEVKIELNTGFEYASGNLIVAVHKPFIGLYGGYCEFYGSYTDYKDRSRYYFDVTAYDPADPYKEYSFDFVPRTRFVFDVNNRGHLEGVIAANGTPVEGALVAVDGTTFSKHSDPNGHYEIGYILEGAIDVAVSAIGYDDISVPTVITEHNTTALDIEMLATKTVAVKGLVVKSDALTVGLENAKILVSGYDNFEATTDADGKFYIDKVWVDRPYTLEITADGCVPYQTEFTLEDTLDLGKIVVDEISYPSFSVLADLLDTDEVLISWNKPGTLEHKEFRNDDGDIANSLLSTNVNSLLGVAYFHNAIIEEVSWHIGAMDYIKPKIIIYGLDAYGMPDKDQLLYESEIVPNNDWEWSTYKLPKSVETYNGFFIGILGTEAQFEIATDDGEDAPYEFKRGSSFVMFDYTDPSSEWIDVEDLGYPFNLMVRAYGVDRGEMYFWDNARSSARISDKLLNSSEITPLNTGEPKYSIKYNVTTRSLESYNVYRLEYGQEDSRSSWESLATNVGDTSYLDAAFSSLDHGVYRFAVEANYSNDLVSDVSFSNVINFKLESEVTLDITTNSGDAEGAVVSLVNQNGEAEYIYTAIAPAGGVLVFDAIWNGTYDLTVKLNGYTSYERADLEISDSEVRMPIKLEEILVPLYNLDIEVDKSNALFSWNNPGDPIFDDFESYDDWSLDFSPWTLLDIDGASTYGSFLCDFPHELTPMSFMIFTPKETNPAFEDEAIQPYSGNKFAASFAALGQSSDDWMICEEYAVESGDVFKFMAKSHTSTFGLEQFTISVSTQGTDLDMFEIISGDYPIVVPAEAWTEYSFDLSAYAGKKVQVGIHHVSYDTYLFMVDDVYVGPIGKSPESIVEYKIYLDNMLMPVARTTNLNYEFTGLQSGTSYTAGVSAVYVSGETQIQTIGFNTSTTGLSNYGFDTPTEVYPNPAKDKLFISSDYSIDQVELYNSIGELIQTYKRLTNGSVDVSGLNTGMYFIQINAGTKSCTKKITIIK